MTLDYFVELANVKQPQKTDEFTAVYHRLVSANLVSAKNKKDADQIRSEWSKKNIRVKLPKPSGTVWEWISNPKIDLSMLPRGSFFVSLAFTLDKPYLSKDEKSFYIIDNPVVRDKVFHLPMVRPSAWKGNLHSALWQMGYDRQSSEPLRRLFGLVHGTEETTGQTGRLVFFPTFFTETGLEIINPHDRKRRVGKNPILWECVPAGAEGTFSLLYVPFDLIGESEEKILQQAAQDLEIVATGLQAMFLIYGFSAKRSSGYGVAEEKVKEGILKVNIEEPSSLRPPEPTTHPSAQVLPKYLIDPGKLKPEYLNPDGTFRERSEAELKAMKKSDRQEYEKAKKWWEREGKLLTEPPKAEPEAPYAVPQTGSYLERDFSSLDELKQKAKELANAFKAGGEQ